jgi:hypothetical protein
VLRRFQTQSAQCFRTDAHTIEYTANEYDPEIIALQADNAKEYEKLGRILWEKYGTRAQFTNAYTPQQNGVAERRMRTIMEHVRAVLFDGNLTRALWAECVRHVTDLLNMTPSVSTHNQTPYELWHNKKPTALNLRVFGCKAFVHVPKERRDKLDPRATVCMYLGLPDHKRGFRLLDVTTGNIVYSRDVTFEETTFSTLKFLTNTPDTLAPANPEPHSAPTPTQRQLTMSHSPKHLNCIHANWRVEQPPQQYHHWREVHPIWYHFRNYHP